MTPVEYLRAVRDTLAKAMDQYDRRTEHRVRHQIERTNEAIDKLVDEIRHADYLRVEARVRERQQ